MSCARIFWRIGAFLVDLVDRHHDRHVSGLRVVDGLHRLRHDAVVGGDHQDRDVGGLRAAGTHGGERLVTRGVDEGDRPYRAVEVDLDLVGADVLGDAAGLFLADVGLTDRVQQSGLAVVDVTHDGHHRRTGLEVFLATLVLAVGEVEGLEQLAVLVLGGHDLHDVVHLAAEQLEGLVADGLGRGHHLTEVEQRLHQRGRVGVDLLGEVGQRRAAGQPDGLAVAVRQPHATDDRRLHRVVFLALLPLRLATTLGRATRTTECACGAAALAWPSTAATATGAAAIAGTRGGASATTAAATTAAAAAAVVTATAATAGATTGACAGTAAAGAGPGPAGTATGGRTGTGRTRGHIARRHAGPRRTRPRGTGTRCLRTRNRPVNRLRRGERVVADARGPRGGLGRTGRGAGPRTRRCAGGGTGEGGVVPQGAGPLLVPREGAAAARGCCGATGLGAGACSGAGFAAAALAGEPLPSALTFSAAGFAPPNDSRSRRATGASTVEDADLTNSPCSLSRARTSLLVTPSSLANSCTRALPATTSPSLEATAVVGAAPRVSYDAWSSGLHGVLMFFATCSVAGCVKRFTCTDMLYHRGYVR